MSAKRKNTIYRPCDSCIHEQDCTLLRGCWQWKKWFAAYWAGLRKKVFGSV